MDIDRRVRRILFLPCRCCFFTRVARKYCISKSFKSSLLPTIMSYASSFNFHIGYLLGFIDRPLIQLLNFPFLGLHQKEVHDIVRTLFC